MLVVKIVCFFEALDKDHKTKGGSNDTDVKLLAVTPIEMLPSMVVTTVTPVTKHPIADLKWSFVIDYGISTQS